MKASYNSQREEYFFSLTLTEARNLQNSQLETDLFDQSGLLIGNVALKLNRTNAEFGEIQQEDDEDVQIPQNSRLSEGEERVELEINNIAYDTLIREFNYTETLLNGSVFISTN